MRFFLALLCLPLAFVTMTGCATAPERRLASPIVEITGLATPASQAGAYVLTVRLTNPNTVPLVVNRATHTLHFGSERLGRIDDRAPVGVPPLGNVTHTLPLSADLASAIRAHFEKTPAPASATLESTFEVLIGTDNDTMTLKTTTQGTLASPLVPAVPTHR